MNSHSFTYRKFDYKDLSDPLLGKSNNSREIHFISDRSTINFRTLIRLSEQKVK